MHVGYCHSEGRGDECFYISSLAGPRSNVARSTSRGDKKRRRKMKPLVQSCDFRLNGPLNCDTINCIWDFKYFWNPNSLGVFWLVMLGALKKPPKQTFLHSASNTQKQLKDKISPLALEQPAFFTSAVPLSSWKYTEFSTIWSAAELDTSEPYTRQTKRWDGQMLVWYDCTFKVLHIQKRKK